MKIKRKIIMIDEERCTGCGQCIPACAEGAIQIVDGKARVVADKYCDGLGACLGECPEDALRIIEREADEFDPEAVELYLKHEEEKTASLQLAELRSASPSPAGCVSSQVRILGTAPSCSDANALRRQECGASGLAHWPVKIRLIPANASFLMEADILVAADCTLAAYPDFHRDFLPGKALLTGCPKFDNVEEYIRKFTEIFKTCSIRSATVLDMEVPCCSALPAIVRKAMEAAGKQIPLEEIVIGRGGKVIADGRQSRKAQ